MFHFRKKKQISIEQPAQAMGNMPEQPAVAMQSEQNPVMNQISATGSVPTADEIFEKTMAPTLSPKAFMEQNALKDSFQEPVALNETQILGAESAMTDEFPEPTVRPEITAWQEMETCEKTEESVDKVILEDLQDEAPTTELFSDPAAHGDVEPDENRRVLRFIGNNGGMLFYHSRQEEENIPITQKLKKQEEAGVWVCTCGTHNYATFCAQCGRPRPKQE